MELLGGVGVGGGGGETGTAKEKGLWWPYQFEGYIINQSMGRAWPWDSPDKHALDGLVLGHGLARVGAAVGRRGSRGMERIR